MNCTPDKVLDFWFGSAAQGGEQALQAAFKRWFAGGQAFDREIAEQFGECIERALAGGLSEWEREAHSRLALILLLDQFPRNVYRGTARAFAGDERALVLARDAVANDMHIRLALVERVFLFMPYQHAEDIEVQREGVELFDVLASGNISMSVQKLLDSSLDYARRHRDIIERFGRFPYRNEALGRETSEAERMWLEESNERFGQ